LFSISVYSFDVYNESGGFSPHDIHDAPVTQESIPGAATATLSDSPVAQSQAPNLNQEKSDQAGLTQPRHQSSMQISEAK